ncbi:MAG: hypothetical protein RLZZ189_812 [Pseudomonadota bacterium]|jgi:hypothetical protein
MFINTSTLEYPVSESQIRKAFPNTSFPSPFVSPEPYAPVYGEAEPQYNPDTHRVEQGAPAKNGDRWEQVWNVVELSAQEKAEREQAKYDSASQTARSERDGLLKESDWTQLDDTPLTNDKKLAWANYRQALRDVPQQERFPFNVQWPQKPE